MMHRAWSIIIEVPYCFSRSYVKFQGHTALKIVEFDPNWAFPDCNSSLNSPMAMKCCTKLETTKERCPIVFQGHPSNFKVTRYKISPILTQKWAFFSDYRLVAAFKSLRFALFFIDHAYDLTKLIFLVLIFIAVVLVLTYPTWGGGGGGGEPSVCWRHAAGGWGGGGGVGARFVVWHPKWYDVARYDQACYWHCWYCMANWIGW